jgi:2'-5' RNA ligase
MIRTFIAIDLPVLLQASLEELQKELRKTDAPVSWVKPDRIHLTLKFLGDVSPERISDIQAQLATIAARTHPFTLQAAGCGAFPTLQQMRVVWVGLKGDITSLRDLQQRVEEAMVPLDFKPEDRPFKAHLTLGRVKGRQRLRILQEALLARQSFEAEDFDVTELVLYKSELRPEGARYTPLFRAAFTQ